MARRAKPWYRKSRRTWLVIINGVRHNLGPNKAEAFDRFYELMRRPEEQPQVSMHSLATIADEFLDWVKKHRAPDTFEWYRYRLERFVKKYPDLWATQVRPFHVENWIDEYDFSSTSRRNHLRTVKRCLSWAVRQGYIQSNPLAHLELPASKSREIAISQAEFETLMSYVRNDSLADLMWVTWETGCRPQESLRVEARHVDLAHQRWVFPKAESKSKRLARVIYLGDKAFAITKRLMRANMAGPIFRNIDGSPWTTDAINCAFTAIQQRMGKAEMKRRGETIPDDQVKAMVAKLKPTRMRNGEPVSKTESELRCEARRKLVHKRTAELAPRYSLYALRHSWATNALQKGIDPLTVAILMGHEDPSMLSRVYQHLSLNPAHMLDQAKRAVRVSG